MPKATKKATRSTATRRAPAAAVATQRQVKDWYARIADVETVLINIGTAPGAHVQMAQQKDSVVATLAALREEIHAALVRAG